MEAIIKKFAIIGAAGYIAPRHMKAIKDTGNKLIAAFDLNDSVGIIDSYFPDAHFFTEFERFDRFVDKWRSKQEKKIDYFAVVTPNYLHDSHIRFALKSGADVICEKPLVLNADKIDKLKAIENETSKKIYNILQLRLHPSIIKLKEKIKQELELNSKKVYNIDLTYLSSRGKWYFESWKGDESKSGGIATNIGVHFYDMLTWIFGEVTSNHLNMKKTDVNAGILELKNARVRWFMSINYNYLPKKIKDKGLTSYRSLILDGQEIDFSHGFNDLHTRSYEEILSGNGFRIDEARSSIDIVSDIRHLSPLGLVNDYHPFCKKVK